MPRNAHDVLCNDQCYCAMARRLAATALDPARELRCAQRGNSLIGSVIALAGVPRQYAEIYAQAALSDRLRKER